MSEPYVRRKSGELLSSADWNAMQRMVREDIARVEGEIEEFEAGIPEAEAGIAEAKKKFLGVRTVSTGRLGTWNFSSGDWQPYRWTMHRGSSGLLTLALDRDSIVQLTLELELSTQAPTGCFQFVLSSSSDDRLSAPVRVLPNPAYNAALSGYAQPQAPTRRGWQQWLEFFSEFYNKTKCWPVCGLITPTAPSGTGITTAWPRHTEIIDLPRGTWYIGLGRGHISGADDYQRLGGVNIRLSATIIPM